LAPVFGWQRWRIDNAQGGIKRQQIHNKPVLSSSKTVIAAATARTNHGLVQEMATSPSKIMAPLSAPLIISVLSDL